MILCNILTFGQDDIHDFFYKAHERPIWHSVPFVMVMIWIMLYHVVEDDACFKQSSSSFNISNVANSLYHLTAIDGAPLHDVVREVCYAISHFMSY